MKPLKFLSVSTKNHQKANPYQGMSLRLLLVIIVIFYLSPSPVFAGHDQSSISHVLKSASELDYPPFSLVTPDGKADGFSVDLLKATTKEIGHEISFSVGSWHELKQNLADGKIDILPLVGYTPERDKVYDFTVPYLRMHGAVFMRKGDTEIKNVTDLKNKEVLVMRGDNAHEFLENKNIAMHLVVTDSYEKAFELLSKGKHDALFSQELVGLLLIKKLGINNLTYIKTLFPEFEQKFSFAVKDGDSSLLADLNEGLSLIVANGTYDRLYEKWFAAVNPETISIATILKYAVAILFPVAILIVIAFIFGLKKEVLRKTRDLQNELSERKKAENVTFRFGRILENSSNEIYTFNAATLLFLHVNQAACKNLGYTMEELTKLTPLDIKPEYTERTFLEILKPLREGDTDLVTFETVHKRKDGSLYPLEVRLNYFSSEIPPLFVAIIQDITERKKAEEERQKMEESLRHTQKLESLGVLAGGIAHDFNNILTGILGNSDLALDDLSPASPVRNYIETIQKETKRATELSNQMLAYSGKGKFIIENINVNEIIKETIYLLEASISKKHSIKYDLTENLPPAEVDITQVSQVIMNLIINASEAIGENNGVISVSTSTEECEGEECPICKDKTFDEYLHEGQYVAIEVVDTGVGMDKDTIGKIFDPFFTTKFTGRGLGMSAVIGIIRGHNGFIRVVSKPGEGTKFIVLLPVSREVSTTTKSYREETATSWGGSGTVLVVDDEETVRGVIKSMLGKIGFNVITAGDGQEAVEIFRDRSNEIDCVILDFTMPRMDGKECLLELRKIRKDIRIIVCSGYGGEETAQKFIDQGANEFLQKPFLLKTLQNKMRKTLEKD